MDSLSVNGFGTLGQASGQKVKLEPDLTHYIKVDTKMNYRAKGKTYNYKNFVAKYDFGSGEDFLRYSPKVLIQKNYQV